MIENIHVTDDNDANDSFISFLDAPIINTTKKFILKHATIGSRIKLNCPTLANPPAQIRWYGENLPNRVGPVLAIDVRNKHYYGNYTCQANNSLGMDQVRFMVEEVGKLANFQQWQNQTG